jgi:uncharacterized membrane protein YGL010W
MDGVRRVDALLADYAAAHRTRGNVFCHTIGITLIVFGVLQMLGRIPIASQWTGAEILIAAAFAFYLSLDVPLAVAVTLVALGLDLAAHRLADWRIGAAAFVAGWIFQGIGHAVYEKRSPAFLHNLVHLLVGPAFLVNEALHIRPVPRIN